MNSIEYPLWYQKHLMKARVEKVTSGFDKRILPPLTDRPSIASLKTLREL